MHPADAIRGSWSGHLSGKTIVLGVAGSIAAVRSVELARQLLRHGADVRVVMSPAALGIITADALEYATGRPPVTRLTGQVEHVAWLGDDGDADLFLIAPATANTVAKIALGIDDTPLTTCAQVALGARRPILIAPAMHAVMEENPATQAHVTTLQGRGVRFVAPLYEEGKAKLSIEAVVAAVLQELGPGTMRGKRALVITGRSEEPVDTVRVLTNRSSGRTGHALAEALHRHGAELSVFTSRDTEAWPPGVHVADYTTLDSLERALPGLLDATEPDWVFVPAALADFLPRSAPGKLKSDDAPPELRLERAPKILPLIREKAPRARIVGWKLEDTLEAAVSTAQARLAEYGIDAVVANAASSLRSASVAARLVLAEEIIELDGDKRSVMEALVHALGTRFPDTSDRAARDAASPRGKTR
jgi:phosphopantothenoylcysteine decarboxylase / phosphopantothenate---cysteine ligase